MNDKVSKRLRSMILISVLAGVTVGIANYYFVSFAQEGGYWCPAEYSTCVWENGRYKPVEPIGGEGGSGGGLSPCDKAGGQWVCPVKSVSSDGMGGKDTCTSTGCRKYSAGASDWVCAFRSSDAKTKCPPLEQCECR